MTARSVEIRQVLREPAIIDRLLDIYRRSIEPSEQKPDALIKSSLLSDRYMFLGAFAGADLLGFAALRFWRRRDFWLLEYLAVDPDARRLGVGRSLLAASQSTAGGLGKRTGLIEVDTELGPVRKRAQARRRLNLYASVGARRIAGLSYILPIERIGARLPMCLLVLSADRRRWVTEREVGDWLRRIYVDVYAQSGADPRLAVMTTGLSSRMALVDAIGRRPKRPLMREAALPVLAAGQ